MAQQQRLGSHKTTHHTKNGVISVVYHSTEVVRADGNTIVLDTGGYFSNTTKTRMNQASNQYGLGFQVYQSKHRWFCNFKGVIYPFEGKKLVLNHNSTLNKVLDLV